MEEFIKRSDEFLQNLVEGKNLRSYFVNANLAVLVSSAIYGATMGTYSGGAQILYSAIKAPLLLLLSLYLTLPSYHILYSLLGGKQTVGQTSLLLLFGFTIMSTVLIALVPVNLFFILTTTKSSTAHAFTALHSTSPFSRSAASSHSPTSSKALKRSFANPPRIGSLPSCSAASSSCLWAHN